GKGGQGSIMSWFAKK
nr:Chain P, Synthetic peptide corresponding to amino acids 437 to 451 of PolD3 from Chaetomium thermophilum [Thermochaetoides thermophila DSM 1495]